MSITTNRLRALARDRRGANMVEYIILVGVVALFAIFAFKAFNGAVTKKVDDQAKTVGQDITSTTGKP